jgi:hypothetical protein
MELGRWGVGLLGQISIGSWDGPQPAKNRVSEESETEEEPPVAKLVFFLEYAAELRTIVLKKSQLKICYTICGRLDAG